MKKKCLAASYAGTIGVMGYSLPRYHDGKKCFVDMFFFDPVSGRRIRKKWHFDSVRGNSYRREMAERFIIKLLGKLHEGINPFTDSTAPRKTSTMAEVFDSYLKFIDRRERRNTRDNYSSRLNVFREFLSTRSTPMCYAYHFTKSICTEFLDWVYHDRESSAQTRNNYRGWLVSLGNFMTERGYLDENPASGIAKMRTGDKLRTALGAADLRRLSSYLNEHDRHFLLACYFEYYTLIRPTELSFLTVGDIDARNRQILVRGKFAKNHKDMQVALNPKVLHLLIDLGVFNHPSGHFIFSKGLRPGEEYQSPEQFNRKWHKLRGVMGWPESYKFYSLKDSGIRDLANESGIVVARDQARHRDITTTNKYLTARGTDAPAAAKEFDGEL